MSAKTIAAVILAVGVAGCGQSSVTHTKLSTTLGSRTVIADVDGPASIQGEGDTATIRAGHRTILVEPTRVLVDGTPVATVPADAKEVHVQLAQGDTTITVDGKPAAP
jgi:uncharacterized Zn-binding protein involved in type VI secretion